MPSSVVSFAEINLPCYISLHTVCFSTQTAPFMYPTCTQILFILNLLISFQRVYVAAPHEHFRSIRFHCNKPSQACKLISLSYFSRKRNFLRAKIKTHAKILLRKKSIVQISFSAGFSFQRPRAPVISIQNKYYFPNTFLYLV